MEMSKTIENNGNWLYFDYKYIGEKVDEKIFQVSLILILEKQLIYSAYCNDFFFCFSLFHGKNLAIRK